MPNSCSFCGDFSHNIRRCNNPYIDRFQNRIKRIFMNLLAQPLNNDQRKIQFTSRLNQQFNVRELKAVAVKYIGIQSNRTKAVFIEKLWFYYLVHIHLLPENQQPYIAEGQDPIIWMIDRTPIPIPFPTPTPPISITTPIPSTPPTPTPTPTPLNNNWIQTGIPSRMQAYDQITNYQPVADEFIPFVSNLLPPFEAETRKFNIVPLLLCMETKEELETASECAICFESTKLEDSVILNCRHSFCNDCVKQTLATCNRRKNPTCALCREPMEIFIVKNQNIYDSVSELCILD
jgi:hypothetical protein